MRIISIGNQSETSDTNSPPQSRPARAKGPEQSGFMMDAVTKNGVAAGILRLVQLYTLVSGPKGPLTRSYAPAAATPCRDHSDRAKKSPDSLLLGLALQGEEVDRGNLSELGGCAALPATLTS